MPSKYQEQYGWLTGLLGVFEGKGGPAVESWVHRFYALPVLQQVDYC